MCPIKPFPHRKLRLMNCNKKTEKKQQQNDQTHTKKKQNTKRNEMSYQNMHKSKSFS